MSLVKILALSPVHNPEILAQVWSLRDEVLRKPLGMTAASAAFEGDDLDTTLHLLALSDNAPVGCLTLLIDPQKPSIQLRGMAVLVARQGSGIGRELLNAAHSIATKHQKNLWCNARAAAIPFYEKNGWTPFGSFFEIPIIGQHIAMQKELRD